MTVAVPQQPPAHPSRQLTSSLSSEKGTSLEKGNGLSRLLQYSHVGSASSPACSDGGERREEGCGVPAPNPRVSMEKEGSAQNATNVTKHLRALKTDPCLGYLGTI